MENHELINLEYKEFCFKINLYNLYSKNDLNAFIRTGVILKNFNDLVIANIKKYIIVYVPRYVSAFHNCNYTNSYVFYIGINDFSEITGIPFKGNLLMFDTFFNQYIDTIVKDNVDNVCCMKVKSEIFKNEIYPEILSDDYLQSILEKYNEQNEMYRTAYEKYTKEKKKWINKIYFFKGKLEDVINNETIKLEFIQFLEQKNMLKMFPEIFKTHYTIPSDTVRFIKNNPNELVYWLILFKDKKVKELISIKPIDPPIPKILNISYCILTQLSSMRKRLVDKNMFYYTMKITFGCSKDCKNKIAYKDQRTKQFRTLTRYICPLKKTPSCCDI